MPAQPTGSSYRKSTHTNRNCKWVNDLKSDPEAGYKRARKHRPRDKGGKGKNKDKEEDSSEAMDEDDASPDPREGSATKPNPFVKKSAGAYHTFLGTPTVRASKSALRILNTTVPAVPQYVSPRIDGYDFSKCLMDGGASLNIMYLETLERMNLTKEQLKHSTTELHGVVPEMITFEVVPFKSSCHVIFGRPTYHKFHARACYIYNKLKIPGPKGMITVSGDYKKAHECELGEATFAESVLSGEELQGYRAAVDPQEMHTTKKQISEQKTSFKAAIETKKIDFKEGDSTKQIRMKKSDQKATSFITPFGTYCYVTMPFGLKNAGATYQRTMQRCLKDQIGRNVHTYVDDIAVMTRKGSDLISDLTETFENLRRFVSCLGEKALPLYKLLKKTDLRTTQRMQHFRVEGNTHLPPILAAPEESEPMLLYLASSNKVISLVIMVERKEEGHEYGVQRPVYYISEVLTESKQRYPHFQKLAYGVFLGRRKLRHYFQDHPVTVVSKAPLLTILNNADATGRTAKWGIELSAFDINYKARNAIKSQILADFVADWIEAPDANLEPEPETWVMHFDESKQHHGSGAGVTLKSPYRRRTAIVRTFTSKLQITWRNTRLYYTVCASLRKLGSSTSYAAEIPTWWHSKWQEPGTPETPLWRLTRRS
ncbi:hypothetical protein QYE76_064846 [Lolium multiflorum]|uniref:Reverse transcriptase domain-containing protein n=1 Tax=Lolium multiflorum TaxID=4521 RepID=A0AAD8W844_LOLMU|nr:hypothetical protein QYE76_064846 [Lolium multiflorum]